VQVRYADIEGQGRHTVPHNADVGDDEGAKVASITGQVPDPIHSAVSRLTGQ